MPFYALLIWIVLGLLVGWFAKRIFGKAGPYGITGDIIAGVVGAIIGGYLLGLLGASGTGGVLVSFLVAIVVALLLVWALAKMIKR